jgi:penicillin-binding protein 1A
VEYDPLPPKRAASAEPAPKPPRSAWRKFLPWLAPAAAAVVLGVFVGIAVAAAIHVPKVDTLSDFTPSLVTRLYDHEGQRLASYAKERRVMLREGEVPQRLQQALLSAEDRNFYQHGGIDALGVVRAALSNLRTGRRSFGASTLTMQLARMLFLTHQKTWRRKIEEAFLAVELEKTFSKEQILTMYCNLVFLGHGNYGMQSASRYFFDKNVDQLTVPEAATLAGIVQLPSRYSPYRAPELTTKRRNYVLRRMHEDGYLTDAQFKDALATPLRVVHHQREQDPAAYFAEEVRQELQERFGSEAVLERGLQVHTTLDGAMQDSARQALRQGLVRLDHRKGWRGPVRHLEPEAAQALLSSGKPLDLADGRWAEGLVTSVHRDHAEIHIGDRDYRLTSTGTAWTGRQPNRLLHDGDVAWFRLQPAAEEGGTPTLMLEQMPEIQGAALILESATGAVRAMVGGFDFERTKFNRATQARRQVGSAFKPFVYGSALEIGMTPADTLLDAPVSFPGATEEEPYEPRNYHRRFYGIMTLRRALEDSVNVMAVKLLQLVGVERVIDFARRCGIKQPLPPYPSLALGSAEITPLEMAAAYASFANNGLYVKPYLIDNVEDRTGSALETHQPEIRKATDPAIAYVLTHMLEGVVQRGTAYKAAHFPLALAGKTGTTDDYTDAWFSGFTPRYTILVWVGYDTKRSLGRNMTGAAAALPIWMQIIQDGLDAGWWKNGETFSQPPGVTVEAVDYQSGLLPGPGSGQVIQEAFVSGTEPSRTEDPAWARVLSLPWYQQLAFYLPKQNEAMPRLTPASTAVSPSPLVGAQSPSAP